MIFSRAQKRVGFAAVGSAVVLLGLFAIYKFLTQVPVYEYDPQHDRQGIITLFERDRYWLTAVPGSSIEYVLDNRSPNKSFLYQGTMQIKVVREHDRFAGFITYYLQTPQIGRVLFLAVDQSFRGKRYGQLLLKYAVDDLIHQGAEYVTLVTRTANYPAQRVYDAVGFKEVMRDEEGQDQFVYYVYEPS